MNRTQNPCNCEMCAIKDWCTRYAYLKDDEITDCHYFEEASD